MFSPNNSPLTSSFEQPVYQHQNRIRNMENQYFNQEYQKSINDRILKQEEQKLKKIKQRQVYNVKNSQFLNDVQTERNYRSYEKQSMANHYEEMIRQKKQRQARQKFNQKNFQRNILGQESWVRNEYQQRELMKMKNKNYSQQLEEHVRIQQQRKRQEIEVDKKIRDRINEQAQFIRQKQYQQLHERSKRKSMFEQRQNQLLGVSGIENYQIQPYDNKSVNLSNSNISLTQDGKIQQIMLKKRQKQIYGKGLDYQRHRYEEIKKSKAVEEPKYHAHQGYNPITNPLPLVYKNPNVLRMLSHK